MKVIDCFPFYNEINMLKYRLLVLDSVVDYFVLVEANHTHAGDLKPLFYQENKDLFKDFQDKIIHIIVDDMPNTKNAWDNENHQRRCISRGLSQLNLADDDILIISDLDEIVNPNIIKNEKQHGVSVPSRLKMDLYYHNLTKYSDYGWNAATMLSYQQLIEVYNGDSHSVRWHGHVDIENAGWHLSSFGDANFIQNKIKNFAHTEFNSDYYTNIDSIQKRLVEGTDLFGRPDVHLKFIPIEQNQNLPPSYEFIINTFK
jgi:beta-1,4-mannosyl-glycoprotein beta-1,4-N-acetylglucosaminyltransferase